jgi:hypothetical protein
MALTVIERKVLEVARQTIRNSDEKYICYAIDKARVKTYDPQKLVAAKVRLRNYISKSLNGWGTLGYWLAKNHNQGQFMTNELQRKARIAWITWMLGEPIEVDAKTKRQFSIYLSADRTLHP